MKKRIFSLLLVLVMVVTMMPMNAEAASNEPANYTTGVTSTTDLTNRLNALMNKYVGTYWTTNGKPCASSSNCHSKYYYGVQCKGFAGYIFNDLFCGGYIGPYDSNKYYIPSPQNATEVGKAWNFGSSDTATVKNILNKAQPGDFIQVRRRGKSYGHSMIVVGVDANGITVFDCNSDGKCGVKKYTQNWATFASKNSGLSLYHSKKYPKNDNLPVGVVDSVTGGINKVNVYGWVYDKDNLDRNITLHVYIGSRMIGEGVADKYRPDVHSTYGVGSYHGFNFDCTVPSDLGGSQPITVFAIDKETGNNPELRTLWASIKIDTTKPKISNVKITDSDDKGYTVSCTATDESGINRVQFPTWTANKEQDDIIQDWVTNVKASGTKSGNTYTYRVNFADHNNEKKDYVTHIYAYDNGGNFVAYPVVPVSAQYNVTYDANGGSGTPSAQKKVHDETLKLSTTKPTKSGNEFTGWNTKADGSGKAYASGASYTGNAALKLYAQWKHVHTYTEKVTKPTCTERGYTTFTCSCGYSYKGNYKDALGHNWNSGKVTTAATCEKEGVKTFTCQNDSSHTKTETITKLGHKWDSGKVTTEAACEKTGVKTYTCQNNSSHTKTEPVPALGHKDTDKNYICDSCGKLLCTDHTAVTVKGRAATCTETGLTDGSKCSKCGHVLKAQEEIKALGHDYEKTAEVEATCVEDGEVHYTCKNEPAHTYVETIKQTGHQPKNLDKVPATCTETGLTSGAICSKCDTVLQEQEVIPALGHDTELKNAKEATCNAVGYTGDEVCKTCGKTVKNGDEIPELGHIWDSGKVIKEATETEEGLMRFTCTSCDGTKEEPIFKLIHIHKYQEAVTKPTCTEQGFTQFTCSCGESYEGEIIEALGHDTQIKNAIEATCTTDGYTGDDVCKTCGKTIKNGDVIPTTGHAWDDGKITKEATETTEGVKQYTCTVCGETKEERIPKKGHTHNYQKTVVSPTCTETGYSQFTCSCGDSYMDEYTEVLGHAVELKNAKEVTCTVNGYTGDDICTICGKTIKNGDVITASGHTWDNGKITTEATETTEGVKLYTCTVCGVTKEEAIPKQEHIHNYQETVVDPTCTEAGYTVFKCSCGDSYKSNYVEFIGHDTELKNAKEATCTEDGYTGDEVCKICGKTIKNGDVITAKGHVWDSGKVTKEPTETAEGVKQYTCTVCSETKEEAIPKLGHIHDYKETVVEPTCTEAGYTLYECGCKDSYKDKFTDMLGHETELQKAKEATCTEDGYTGDEVCNVCGKTVKSGDVITAKGHVWDSGKVTKEPTETAEGVKQYACTVCGETKEEAIPAISHEHTFEQKIVKPTCTEAGYTEYICSCGESYREDYVNAVGHSFSAGKCTVCGAEEPMPGPAPNPFIDVVESDYFYAPVLWAVEKGVTGGTSANTFSPNNPCTRGQVVTFLWAASGRPEPKSNVNPFFDVSESDYFYKAVLWAVENGITGGIGNGQFGPNQPCTRAQVVTFLYASEGKPDVVVTVSSFTDVPDDAWFREEVQWAVREGITGGVGNGLFGPDQTCTRGQIATFLYKALSNR